MFAAGVTMALTEWIIDDTCLVLRYFRDFNYIDGKIGDSERFNWIT